MRKFLSILTAAFSLLAFSCSSTDAARENSDIVILYTNDVHCGVEDNIGYAGLALYREQMLKETPYVTLVDAGDFAQGATIGSVSGGEYIAEIMNKVGYEIAVPGNHEFDYGIDQVFKLAKKLDCGFISANFKTVKNGKNVFPAYKIKKYGNRKVAFVGICTPESITKSTPAYFQDKDKNFIYDFGGDNGAEGMIRDIQAAIDESRSKGADYVVLVGHLGQDGVREGWTSREIAAKLKGADVLIDGHSHEVYEGQKVAGADGKETIITQTGTKLNNIGKLVITYEGNITTTLVDKITDESGKTYDEGVYTFIQEIKGKFEGSLKRVIGKTGFDLKAVNEKGEWLVRDRQTNLGDLVTDAIKDYFNADLSLVNGGGLRADIKAGDITYNNALTTIPFGNKMCLSEIKGSVLLDELEYAVRMLPKTSGGFLHVSGITFTVDSSIPTSVSTDDLGFFREVTGDRRISDLKVNGQPLDPEKMYKVASIDYVLKANGDGHMFRGSTVIRDEPVLLCDALASYIEKLGSTLPERYRESQNRIIVK